jgi:hypothetical protein
MGILVKLEERGTKRQMKEMRNIEKMRCQSKGMIMEIIK